MKEKRSLFKALFGNGESQPTQKSQTRLQLLNGYNPTYIPVTFDNSNLVKTAINTIATHCSKLNPLHIQSIQGSTNPINGNINRILNLQPNPLMTTTDFIYKVVYTLFEANNSFIFIKKDKAGMIEGFYPITAGKYELLEDTSNTVWLRFKFVNGKTYTLPYTDVIHLRRFFHNHDIYGDDNQTLRRPVEVAGTAMQGIDNAVKTTSFLRGILKTTQSMLKEKDTLKLKDDFVRDFMNIENESGIAVLDSKCDFTPINNTPISLSKDQLDYTKANIYDYFGINEKIIQSKFTSEEWNAFYESVIEPVAIAMGQAFTARIFSHKAIKEGHQIVFSTNRIRYAKTETKIQLIKETAVLGIITVDEAREVLDMPPLGGEEGKKRIQTLNVVDATKANDYQIGGGTEDGE